MAEPFPRYSGPTGGKLDEWVAFVVSDLVITERQLELHIRPRPPWLPRWAWSRLIGCLLLTTSTSPRCTSGAADEAES